MEDLKKVNKGFKIFILLFALMVLVFIQDGNQEKFIDLIDKLVGKNMELILDREYEGNNLLYFKGHILKWEQNSLIFHNNDGSQNWVKDFSFQEPEVVLGENYIYTMDKSTGDIYKINRQGDTILRVQLNTPVLGIKESNKHLISHIKGEEEGLIITNEEGENIANQSVDGNILTSQINEDGSEYIYSTIEMDGRDIVSVVFINNIDGDMKYSLNFDDEIIFTTDYIGNKIVLLTDTTLRVIQNGEVKWSKEYPLIKDIYIGENNIYLLYGNNLDLIDSRGRTKDKISFAIDYDKIVPLEKSIGLYGNNNLSILQNGREIIKYIGEKEFISVRGYKDFIALNYENHIEVHKIQDKN